MRRLLILVLALSLLTCSPLPGPHGLPGASSEQLRPIGTAERVVLMSFDGMGADALAWQGRLLSFERMAREGAQARVIPVNPTVTSSTHAAILTGASPQRSGIVSNRIHLPGTPPDRVTRGMDIDPEVETIIEAARRQGRRVGVVSFPGIDNSSSRRSADFGMAWAHPLTQARMLELTKKDFRREWVPPTWSPRPQPRKSFNPIMRARVQWGAPAGPRADVDIVAYDTTDDQNENYDAWFVEVDGREIGIDPRGWFAVERSSDAMYGSWSKFIRASPSLDVTLYWGAVSRTNAWPGSFRAMIEETAGFWPGVPEEHLDAGDETFREQMERLATFYTVAQTMTIRRMAFDLLLLYQPQIDQASHHFLGRPEGESAIRLGWETADSAIASIFPLLDDHRDALIVTGDHGLVPASHELRMNRLLEDHGFAPRWRALTSGSVAHLYRFGGPDDRDAVVSMLERTGHFERIERKGTDHHPNSGEVIVWSNPSIYLSHSSEAPVFRTVAPFGQHGAWNTTRELHPPLLAWGSGVPRGHFADIPQTRIARFVSGLLGITPPAAAE